MNEQRRISLFLRLRQLHKILDLSKGHLTKKDRAKIARIIMVMPFPVYKFIVSYLQNKRGKK